jgi:hypothetical protein
VGYGHTPSLDCSFYFPRSNSLEIAGFDRLWQLQVYTVRDIANSDWTLSNDQATLELAGENQQTVRIDLQGYLKKMTEKYNCYERELAPEDAILETEETNARVKLIVEEIAFIKGDTMKVNNLRGIVLLKEKNK